MRALALALALAGCTSGAVSGGGSGDARPHFEEQTHAGLSYLIREFRDEEHGVRCYIYGESISCVADAQRAPRGQAQARDGGAP